MNRKLLRGVAFVTAAAMFVSPPVLAQTSPKSPPPQTQGGTADRYNVEQLDALLAQIALYPDDLLAQVLMASTYPLQIVEASRWLSQGDNKSLTGDALVKALEPFNWDPSVKSLVPFPQVLSLLDSNLDWTQQLGYAFSTQETDVWNSVQRLRAQAQAAGQLKSTPQQTVTVDNGAYVIRPADPQTVYVPVYNPSVVYGGWPYPSYPPVYYPPPPSYNPYAGALATGLAFAAGAAVVGSLWGWSSPRWNGEYGGSLYVNNARYNNINVNRAQLSANNSWRAPAAGGIGGRPARPPGGPVGQPGRVAQLPANAIGRPNVQVPGNLVRPGGGNVQRPGGGGVGGGPGGGGNMQRPGGGGIGPGGGNISRPGGQPGGGAPIQRPGGGGGNLTRPGGQPGGGAAQRPALGGGAQQRPAGGMNRGQTAAVRPAGAFGGVSDGARAGQFGQRGAQSRNFQHAGGGGVRAGGGGRFGGGGGGARAGGGGGGARAHGGGGGRRGR